MNDYFTKDYTGKQFPYSNRKAKSTVIWYKQIDEIEPQNKTNL